MATWIVEEPKWHWTLQRHLSHLQDQGILCDTKLACANGKTIKAHSCVLAAASDRIRNLLDGVQSNDYTLRMDSVTSTTWHYILRFIYDGRVALPLDQVERVKDAAIRFQIEPLISLLSTLEKIRGKVVAVDSNVVEKTSSVSCQDKDDDVIVLDDEDDDDDDGVLVVEKESSVASDVTVPTKDGVGIVSRVGNDCVELGLSSPRCSRLAESTDDGPSTTLGDMSLPDDSSANVSVEKAIVSNSSETHECVSSDNVSPDTCDQSTDIDGVGLQVSSKSFGSSSFSSVIQNTSQCTVLSETRGSRSSDANDAFDVSEVICMDSPASGCTKAEDTAAKKSCDQSERVPKRKSLTIRRKSCGSTVPSKTLSFVQPVSFAARPFSDIYSQFMVARPSEMTLPVVVETNERTDTLETTASDGLFVHERGTSDDKTGPVSSPSEVRADDEPPLLCISNIVSLSGQMTDFFEPDSAFNSNPSPLKVVAEVATDDLRTQESYVEDGSSTATHFVSVSPPTILENPISNSTERVTTQTMHSSNFAAIPQTSSRSALHINLSSSTILSEDGYASMHPNSMDNLSGSRAAFRVLLARSPEPANGSRISNVRLVSLPHDSLGSTIPQSMVSSRFGGYEQFPAPSTVPVPAVSHSDFVEDFHVSSVVSFPAVPLSGHVEEFPVPSVVSFPPMPHLYRQEEFPAPPVVPFGAISRVPRPFLELSDSDKVTETHSKPAGSVVTFVKVRAKKTLNPALKNQNKLSAENTATKRPRLLKNGVSLKSGRKRRKSNIPVETGMISTEPSDGVTEYAWPGDSGQFSGCTEVITDHDYQRKSSTGEPSIVAQPVQKTRKSAKPLSVVGSSGKPDFSPVTGSASFVDETSFVQPDSTVLETRPLPLKESVYNFMESEESNMLPGMPQPSITSTQPTGTADGSAIIPKRRGRPPNSEGRPAKPKLAKNPAETETTKQQLLQTEDKPKKTRKRRRKLTVDESAGSSATIDPPRPPPTVVSFVGREIRHEWVVEMESRATRWYAGKVLSVVSGKDGERKSQYEVKYEGEEISYLIDHLFEDYLDGSLTFV